VKNNNMENFEREHIKTLKIKEHKVMNLKLEKFVREDKIKKITTELLEVENDTKAINLLKEITSIGELKKLRVFLQCQRRDIGNNFTALAIYISTIALVLPAIDKLNIPYLYIFVSISLAIGLGMGVLKEGVPFINKTNEHNSKVDYLLWLIDEELNLKK
jgi:hypothetical protein